MTRTFIVLIATTLLSVSGFAAPSSAPANPPSASSGATAPTDAQIAAIVLAANNADIAAGKVAKSQSKNGEVKKLAQQMVTDHTAVNKEATALTKKLKMAPEENETSRNMKKMAEEKMAEMKNLKGHEFDKAYIDNEVAFHQTVLDSIDNTLLPSAKNEELKQMLTKVRPNIASHLEHAKHVQTMIK